MSFSFVTLNFHKYRKKKTGRVEKLLSNSFSIIILLYSVFPNYGNSHRVNRGQETNCRPKKRTLIK